MAYTSIIPVHRLDNSVDYVLDEKKASRSQNADSLQAAVDYALNKDKTEQDLFCSAIGCTLDSAFEDMCHIKRMWHKEKGVQGFHLVQSFAAGEVTPELAHQIGQELANRLLGGRFQVVISTHLNTGQMFEAVQRLMKRRAATHTAKPKPGGFPLSHMIKCGFCGSTFQRHLKKEGARWCCYQHRKDKSLCVMEVVAESEVYQTFLLMYNKLLDNKNLILRVMLAQLIELQSKTTFARPEIVDLHQIISDLARQNHSLSRLQAKGCIDSAIFIERSNRNNKLIEELRFELRQLQEPDRVSETIDQTNLLLDLLDDAQPMLEFEPSIFKSMIKEITVYPEKFSFVLSNGLVLCEMRR